MNTVLSRAIPRALVSAALAALAIAAPASAAPRAGAYVATLARPLNSAQREILGDKLWKCEGNTCTTTYDGAHAVRTCAAVARKFGAVAAFATPRGGLTAEQLAACNEAG